MRKKLSHVLKIAIFIVLFLSVPMLFAGEGTEEPVFIQTPDVVYVGSPYDIVSQMLHLAQVKKDDLVVDLGCGDARMLVLAAQKYGSRGKGYEIDPVMVTESRKNAERNSVSGLVTIIQADIFTVDISDADVLPVYLLPEMNLRLVPQFETLKPGSRLVFHNYDLYGYIPDKKVEIISNEDNSLHTLWLYTTPLKKEG
ncbi:MAG: methyltransferase domain-containing protein [Deltaproteobacteria bacterium]|jgi:SAM-dependent methyltransferase|nr:methyltransferase domain-containing protein [Deltaproteobacteria bacterium]